MTPDQLTALQSYTSAVAMYVAGDGNYARLKRAADLLEIAFGVKLPERDTPGNRFPDIL